MLMSILYITPDHAKELQLKSLIASFIESCPVISEENMTDTEMRVTLDTIKKECSLTIIMVVICTELYI